IPSLNSCFRHPITITTDLHSFPTRRSSDLSIFIPICARSSLGRRMCSSPSAGGFRGILPTDRLRRGGKDRRILHPSCATRFRLRSEEHTSELQSHLNLVCRLLLEKKKIITH